VTPMKRPLIIAAIVLVLVIVGVGVFLYNSMDSIVKAAIEKYGSEITGTKVSVSAVDFSLKSGRGTIRGITVHNPKGFSSNPAFRLGEITVDVDVASLNKDPIVIDEVKIGAPELNAEMDKSGKTNITVIKNHADGYRSDGATTRKEKEGYEKRFRISRFSFEEGKVHGDAEAVGAGSFETDLPPVHMTNVGGNGGASPGVIGREITRAFLGAAMDAATHEIQKRATGALKSDAEKALQKVIH
jgi:uncharacterized protein involved in outer membrane biogenesis